MVTLARTRRTLSKYFSIDHEWALDFQYHILPWGEETSLISLYHEGKEPVSYPYTTTMGRSQYRILIPWRKEPVSYPYTMRGRNQYCILIPWEEGASLISLYHERKEPVSYSYTMRGRSQYRINMFICTNWRDWMESIIKHKMCPLPKYIKLVCVPDKTLSEKNRQLVVGGSMCKIDVQHH